MLRLPPRLAFQVLFCDWEKLHIYLNFRLLRSKKDFLARGFIKLKEGCVFPKVEVFFKNVTNIIFNFACFKNFSNKQSFPNFFSVFLWYSILDRFNHIWSWAHHVLDGITKFINEHSENKLVLFWGWIRILPRKIFLHLQFGLQNFYFLFYKLFIL